MLNTKLRVECTIDIQQDEAQCVAHAMPLDVMSSGYSRDGARRALAEAVLLFLKTAADLGTLEDVLDDCGYTWRGEEWVCPMSACPEKRTFEIGE